MVRNADPKTITRTKLLRTGTRKLVFRLNWEHELYDLVEDPRELVNRYGDPAVADVERSLERRLLERLIEADAVLPVSPNPRA